MLALKYYQKVIQLIERAAQNQWEALETAAQHIASSLSTGGILHVFGTGHSAILAKEIVQRAGGLVPISQIPEPSGGVAERVEGYGPVILDHYAEKYGLFPGEVIIIISASGRNPVPIDIAITAKKLGLFTIGLTSLEYSNKVTSRHSSGKKLYEVVDCVLDTGVPFGDAIIEIDAEHTMGPISTIIGALLLNMLMISVAEKLKNQGYELPVLKSQNMDGADVYNKRLLKKYRGRLNA